MSSRRVQVILHETERALLKKEAASSGTSLSAWIRKAALEKVREKAQEKRLDSVESLKGFFAQCDEREKGTEPDWEEHLAVIAASVAGDRSGTRRARGGRSIR